MQEAESKLLKCVASLAQATREANPVDINALLKMKLQDFIIFYAVPLGIQFKVVKPRVRKGPLK